MTLLTSDLCPRDGQPRGVCTLEFNCKYRTRHRLTVYYYLVVQGASDLSLPGICKLSECPFPTACQAHRYHTWLGFQESPDDCLLSNPHTWNLESRKYPRIRKVETVSNACVAMALGRCRVRRNFGLLSRSCALGSGTRGRCLGTGAGAHVDMDW